MKVLTCFVPKKLLCSPKIQKLSKCIEIKVKCKPVKDCYKGGYDTNVA